MTLKTIGSHALTLADAFTSQPLKPLWARNEVLITLNATVPHLHPSSAGFQSQLGGSSWLSASMLSGLGLLGSPCSQQRPNNCAAFSPLVLSHLFQLVQDRTLCYQCFARTAQPLRRL